MKLDLVAAKDGFFADAAVTVPVGRVSTRAEALARCAEAAFWKATKVARVGFRSSHIGREVERHLGCLAHASYMIGSKGIAAVIDPQRDVDIYVEAQLRKSGRSNTLSRPTFMPTSCRDIANLRNARGRSSISVREPALSFLTST